MTVGRFEHNHAIAHVFRLDRGLVGDRTTRQLADEIANALHTGRHFDMADGPLHGARLHNRAGLAIEIADQLTAAHVHFGRIVGVHGAAVRHGKIALPLHDLENALLRDNRGIVIIRQIVNTHECSFAGNTLLIILWMSRDNLPVCEIDIPKDIISQRLLR